MALVALILGVAGPFGTYQYLATAPRLVYWLAVVIATYGLGAAIGMAAGLAVRTQLGNPALRALAYGVLIGPAVTLAVLAINVLTFGPGGLAAIGWVELLVYCTLVAAGRNQ
jgi:hypothetical protein